MGALVAAATLFFTLIKTWINERTTTADEEGLITDRINAAVASLGAEKTEDRLRRIVKYDSDDREHTVFEYDNAPPNLPKNAKIVDRTEWINIKRTLPNIEVRIGAILALERMAKKNADVHIQIMEILTAYIRENAPRTENYHDNPPRQDIQLAFTVIGRRPLLGKIIERKQKPEKYRLDLRNCDFTKIEGKDEPDFDHCIFDNSSFKMSKLQNIKLNYASLKDANLYDADFSNAKIGKTELNRSLLVKVKLQGINFKKIGSLKGACFKDLNLLNIPISQDQIDTMFGDGSVTLPESMTWPSHWPKEELSDDEFYTKWEEWKKNLPPDRD